MLVINEITIISSSSSLKIINKIIANLIEKLVVMESSKDMLGKIKQ